MIMVVRTEFKMPNGTQVTVEGSEEEVIRVVAALQTQKPMSPSASIVQAKVDITTKNKGKNTTKGPMHHIRELVEEGFFSQPRGLSEIKLKLAENGHHYPLEGLSTPIKRLVQQKEIRRFKENGIWRYTHS